MGNYQRVTRIADYVLALLDDLLESPSRREVRFDWCRGDPGAKRRQGVSLPFDACWPERHLLVEVHEDQHWKPVAHFDKPDRLTVSGVHRGTQRKLYDERKVQAARSAGYLLIVIPWDRRKPRDAAVDRARLVEILNENRVEK